MLEANELGTTRHSKALLACSMVPTLRELSLGRVGSVLMLG